MAKVKVRNLWNGEYKEEFRDQMITIPGGGFVEMGRSEAIAFLGQMSAPRLDGQGIATNPKMLRIEEDPEDHAAARDQPFRFTAPDGKEFRSQAGYDAYLLKLIEDAKTSNNEEPDDKPKRRRRAKTTEDVTA